MNKLRFYGAILDWQSRAVWGRHMKVYRRNWYTAFLPPAAEPVLLLLAFGLGLGAHVGGISFGGREVKYASYIAPGIIAYTIFLTAFFQTLYGAFIRMHYQRTWEGQLTTQVELPHVIWGEIIWATVLAAVYASIVAVVIILFNFTPLIDISVWGLIASLPFCFLFGVGFAAAGLAFTAWMPSIDHMNLPVFLIGMPMAFTSNTYFPIPQGNPWLDLLVQLNPVFHMSELTRGLMLNGELGWSHLIIGLSEVLIIVLLANPPTCRKLRRRVLGDSGS